MSTTDEDINDVLKRRAQRGGLRVPDWVLKTRHGRRIPTRSGEDAWKKRINEITSPPLCPLQELNVAGQRWAAYGSTCSADLWLVIATRPVYRLLLIDIIGHGDLSAYFACLALGGLNEALRHGKPESGAAASLAWAEDVIVHIAPGADELAS